MQGLKASNEYFLHDISISKVLVFLNFVYNPMGASSTSTSPTGSPLPQFIFWCITSLFCIVQISIFCYKKEQKKKFSLIWYQTYLDMWSIFGVKLNYIVIFENWCNSSTLLMELFMICGQDRIITGSEFLQLSGVQALKGELHPKPTLCMCLYVIS